MTSNRTFKPVLAAVKWRDLAPMRFRDGIVECLHPLPWLFGGWAAVALGYWMIAVPCSFMLFLTALRLNHEAIHHNLGFGARGHRTVLHGLSALMLGSNSAVAFNHLQHHKHIGTDCDLEGACGRMTMAQVIAHGPLFPVRMHIAAWRDGGPAVRRRMRIDFALNAALLGGTAISGSPVLLYHLAAMAVAQCLTAFFAVWITHHDCAAEDVARTQHSAVVNFMTYNMLLHLEHHLFPGEPVRRLGSLAARIAAAAPDFAARERLVVPEPWR